MPADSETPSELSALEVEAPGESQDAFNQEEVIQHDDVSLSTVDPQCRDDASTPELDLDTSVTALDAPDTLTAVEAQLQPDSELTLYDESQIGSEVLENITVPSAVPPLPFETGLEVNQTLKSTALSKYYTAGSTGKPSRRGPGRPRKDGLSPVPRYR